MTGFDESGSTLVCDFDFAAVDSALAGTVDPVEAARISPTEAACECQRQIWAWVYSPPCEDMDGFTCRSIIACWVFVPQLREYTMTQIAQRFGKKKQSLGRWVADFKVQFKEVANHCQHMHHD